MMNKKLIRDFIQISISQLDPQQVRIAKYLRNTGKITSQLMEAVVAYWDSIAISEDPSSSDEDIELALLNSLNKLHCQMSYIVDYHRVKRKIQLPPETLMKLGLLPIQGKAVSSPVPVNYDSVESSLSIATSLSAKLIQQNNDEDEDEDEDGDQKDEKIMLGGGNVSQSVADFLNGR